MIEIKVYSTRRSFYSLGMDRSPGERLAVPGVGLNGTAPRMPLDKAKFSACRAELTSLAKRGAMRFEATNGSTTQEVTLEQVAEFFAKQAKPAPEPLPAPAPALAKIVPPPAPWMTEGVMKVDGNGPATEDPPRD